MRDRVWYIVDVCALTSVLCPTPYCGACGATGPRPVAVQRARAQPRQPDCRWAGGVRPPARRAGSATGRARPEPPILHTPPTLAQVVRFSARGRLLVSGGHGGAPGPLSPLLLIISPTSPSSWTSFGASAEASSFPPPHTSNLHSFSLSPSQGRHPLRQLRQQRRGRIRRRRRPPVARRRRRRYRPRHPPWCAPARRRDRRQDRPPSPPGRRRPCHRRPGLPRRPWRRCRCRQPPSPPPTPPMDRSHARTGARTGGCVIILLCMVGLVHVHAKA